MPMKFRGDVADTDEYATMLDTLTKLTGGPPDPSLTVAASAYAAADAAGRKLLSALMEKALDRGLLAALDRVRADAAIAEVAAEMGAAELLQESEAGRAVLELAARLGEARDRVDRLDSLRRQAP